MIILEKVLNIIKSIDDFNFLITLSLLLIGAGTFLLFNFAISLIILGALLLFITLFLAITFKA